jgi:signal transduction histidine kinase
LGPGGLHTFAVSVSAEESAGVAPVTTGVGRALIADAVRIPTPTLVAAVAAAGIACAALAATLTIRSRVLADPVANGATRGFLIASWVAVGLVTWRRRPHSRLGPLMVAAAAAFAATTVMALPGAAFFSIGHIAWAGFFVLFVFVLLVFPDGRLDPGGPTVVFRTALCSIVLLWLPVGLLSSELPAGLVLTWCAHTCPRNALQLADIGTSASRLASGAAGVVTSGLWIAVAIMVLTRLRSAGGLARRTLTPLLLPLCVAALCAGVSEFVRHVSGQVPVAFVFGWIAEAGAMAIPLALLLGQARGRLLAGAVMRDAVPRFAVHKDRREVQATLAKVLRDPSLELFFWMPSANGYFGVGERRYDPEQLGGRSVTEIRRDDRLVAVIVHDQALDPAQDLVAAAGAAALLAIENIRLEGELRASVAKFRDSLARIASASLEERRRLERDIHDSAQNRLVALRVKLALAEDRIESSAPTELRETFAALGEEAQEAIDALRRIAHGAYPPLLAMRGLGHALANETKRATLPVRVIGANDIARSTPDTEDAVYFCCLEAVQNSLKHAGAEAHVTVRLVQSSDVLTFVVEDDGVGFDRSTNTGGEGLTNIRDRISAVGGAVEVTSKRGVGTMVSGTVPWPLRRPEPYARDRGAREEAGGH